MKIVFASNNHNKLNEIQLLVGINIEVLSLKDINCFDDIEETGVTLEENAMIKSNYVKNKFNYDCFADDTGLEIESLNNEPGVYSARYSGDRDSNKNMDLVLQKMQNIENRNARFRTVISLNMNDKIHLFEGIVNGCITYSKSGQSGFGYDPIFVPNGFNKTFADMSIDEKNKISHRAQAIQKLVSFLKQQVF